MRKTLKSLTFGAAAMALVLSACSGAAPAPTAAPAAPAKPVATTAPAPITIEYWQYNFASRIEAMNELIKQFEAENPGIKVVHNSEIPYDNFIDKVAASAPAGVGPDVVTLFNGWVPSWVNAGYLVPLPEKDFLPADLEKNFSAMILGTKFQGKYWTVPTAVRALALFWNKDHFKAAGLDPEKPPATLDEFVDYAKKLTIKDGEKITQQGFAVEMTGQAHQWFREVLSRQYGASPFTPDNKTVGYGDAKSCQAFKWLLAFETDYKTGSNDLFDGATTAFQNGKESMHIDGSFRLGALASKPDLKWGVAPLPTKDGIKANFGSFWTHGITKKGGSDPKRLEAATKFLKFITTPAAGLAWVKKTGELPAQLSAAADPDLAKDAKYGAFAKQLSYSYATFFVDEAKQRKNLIDAFDAVRLQKADPCVALADAVKKDQALYDEFWAKNK